MQARPCRNGRRGVLPDRIRSAPAHRAGRAGRVGRRPLTVRRSSCAARDAARRAIPGRRPDYVSLIHAGGALHLHNVGSAREAREAIDADVDAVVAQGWEAWGHVWGEVATTALLPAVVDAIAPAPVIAAGGIADGRALAAALVLGAQATWFRMAGRCDPASP
ncbi:MAG: nitronate monooxygenase [Solirubrobacteraceae bacterium]